MRRPVCFCRPATHDPQPSTGNPLPAKCHQLDFRRAIIDRQARNRRLEVEPTRARGARVYRPPLSGLRDELTVGVPINDDIGGVAFEQPFGRRTSELMSMTDVHGEPVDPALDRWNKPWITRGVCVSIHSENGRDHRELVEHLVAADVACVQNQLDARERLVHVRSNEPVGVGDETDDARAQRSLRTDGGGRKSGRTLRSSPPGARALLSALSPHLGTRPCSTSRWSRIRATTKSTRSSIRRGR